MGTANQLLQLGHARPAMNRTEKSTKKDNDDSHHQRERKSSLAQAFESWVGAEEDQMETPMNNFPEMNQLPPLEEIERKPSIEALQSLSGALKASSSSECLTRLRQAPSVSKLHRLARFLHLKHS